MIQRLEVNNVKSLPNLQKNPIQDSHKFEKSYIMKEALTDLHLMILRNKIIVQK